MPLESGIPIAVAFLGVLAATVTDLWKFKVYNVLTLPTLAFGLLFHLITGGLHGLGGSTVAMLIGFFSLVPFFAIGAMGAGDVKLMAAVGACLGMPLTVYVILVSSLAAGVYAIGLLFVRGGLDEVYINFLVMRYKLATISKYLAPDQRVETEVGRPGRRCRLIPFAGMIAVGIVGALAWLNLHGEH